jgi:hypothetical protein
MSGRCLAGKEVEGQQLGAWVRPVSGREHQEISEQDRSYEDGQLAQLLEIISIPMLEPIPGTYQSENHLIGDQWYWSKLGVATWAQVDAAVDRIDGPLWLNGYSSGKGINDRIPSLEAAKLQTSLLLIRPTELRICVAPKGDWNAPEKRSVRTRFSLNGCQYNIGLTDPKITRHYLRGNDGTFSIADALLCISLGEQFNDYVYKLAAALITPDRLGGSDE